MAETKTFKPGRERRKGKHQRRSDMDIVPIMALITVVVYVALFLFRPETTKRGFGLGLVLLKDFSLTLIPLVIMAIMVVGLVQAFVSPDMISALLGEEAGFKGIVLGTLLGLVMPGGPFIAFPVAGVIFKSGASVGTTVAFITSWSLLALGRIPMELPFLGPKLVAIRIGASFIFPVVIGVISGTLHRMLK
jgi:uncharacterized membrane protein YraQ (UPF0718 family)